MNSTKTAVRIVKHLLPSIKSLNSCVPQITYRSITFGQDHPTFGLFDKLITRKEIHLLDRFLGHWVETKSDNYCKYLEAAGVTKSDITKREKQPTWIAFSRLKEEWICRTGITDVPGIRTFMFKLNQEVSGKFDDESQMKTVFTQDGKILRERQETLNQPKRVVYIVREAKDHKMTATYSLQDVTMKRTYKKR